MKPLIVKYLNEMDFEVINGRELTTTKLEELPVKEGVVCTTNSTDLCIFRKLVSLPILGIETVMESTTEYTIVDSFGMTLWVGSSQEVYEYVQGFINEKGDE